MNVLIVDDDSGARALMRRVLVRDFNVHVVEADDGVTGLERLLAEPIDLLLLDIKMRVMDGMRTLEAVRRSPKYASLRVVMMTGLADQERVTRAMELGVTDFIVKPFTQAALRDRLARLIGAPRHTAGDAEVSLDLKATDRLMVLDRDVAFRDFVAATAPLCRMESADSELTVLKQCETGPLAAIVVGKAPGVLDWDVFVQSLRATAHGGRVPLIGAVRSADLEEARHSGRYDAVILRTFEAGSFTRGLAPVLSEASLARLLLGPSSSCLETLFTTACTVVGTPLRQTLTAEEHDHTAETGAPRWIFGSLTVFCAQMTWELRLHLPFPIGLEVARAPRHLNADNLSEADVLAATGELTRQLGAHLCDEAAKFGLKPRVSGARMGVLPAGRATMAPEPSAGVTRYLLGAGSTRVGVVQFLRQSAAATGPLRG